MYPIDQTIDILDELLSTDRKRHLVGGTLISIGLLCFGLAITAISLKEDTNE